MLKLCWLGKSSPQCYFIWNKYFILYKTIIGLVFNLFHTQWYLMSYDEFLVHFNIPLTPKKLSLVLLQLILV